MADYKRMISYMYYYEDNMKRNNVGYARIEVRSGTCKIKIHVQCLSMNGKTLKVYSLHRDTYDTEGIFLGEIVPKNGVGEMQYFADANNIGDSLYGLEDMGGIILYASEDKFFGTEWDDQSIDINSFREWKNKRPVETLLRIAEVEADGQKEEQVVFAEENGVMELVDSERDLHTKSNAIEREANKYEEVRGTLSNPTTDLRQKNQVRDEIEETLQEKKQVNAGTKLDFQENAQVSEERKIDLQERDQVFEEVRADLQENVKVRNEVTQEQQEFNTTLEEAKRDTNIEEAEKEAAVADVSAEKQLNQEQQMEFAQENPRGRRWGRRPSNRGMDYMQQEPIKAQESYAYAPPMQQKSMQKQEDEKELEWREEVRQVQQSIMEKHTMEEAFQKEMQKAEEILIRFPKLYPFEGNEMIDCVRIEPQDLGVFPMDVWSLANNSFLLHGYYSYRHLIFSKRRINYGYEYIIGIPGIYQQREKFMAKMFGFEHFKCIKEGQEKTGDFGYWYRTIFF